MSITKGQIIAALSTFSIEDIKDINRAACAAADACRGVAIATAKQKLYVGQKVEWNGKFGQNSGRIIKVNRTKCIVEAATKDCGGRPQKWTVPMTMLKAI